MAEKNKPELKPVVGAQRADLPAVRIASKTLPETTSETPAAPKAAPQAAPQAAPKANRRAGAFPEFMKEFNFANLLGEMKLPAMPAMPDMQAVLAAHKRNLEVMAEANRVALEGAQAFARRHMEITQETLAAYADRLKSLSKPQPPASHAAKQAELLKYAYENAVSHTRELGDLLQKSNAEAAQKLNQRFSEAMAELTALFNKL